MSELISLRKKLHASPELSCFEVETQKIVLNYLMKFSPSNIIPLADGKALLVEFDSGTHGSNIVFRADLDALPVHEKNSFEYASQNSGVAHKCGHDGHMTLACSLPAIWKASKVSGKLGILFQHAEEIAVGAKEIIADENFKNWKPDFVFGMHNLPGFNVSDVVISQDIFSCASMGLRISLEGSSSHAGEPEKANSPYFSLLKLVEKAQTLISKTEDDHFFLSTLVHLKLGNENYGITPGDGIAAFTLRAKYTEHLLKQKELLIKLADTLASENSLKLKSEIFDYFPATKNTAAIVLKLEEAAVASKLNVINKDFPFRWSEDFGFFAEVAPCAYFGIGNGEKSFPLHHPEYDFNDNVLETFHTLFKSFFSRIPGKK